MATVGLTPYVISRILDKMEHIIVKGQEPYKYLPEAAPAGVGDEVFSLFLSPEHEKQILSLVPDKMFPKQNGLYVDIAQSDRMKDPYYCGEYVLAQYSTPHLHIPGRAVLENLPGIKQAVWHAGNVRIELAEDDSVVQSPTLRDYIATVKDINVSNTKNKAEVQKARTEMEAFLRQHRTLQKAIKSFGPGGEYLMEFVPDDIKRSLDAEPKTRTKREKPAPVTIDTDYLIGVAAAHKLNL